MTTNTEPTFTPMPLGPLPGLGYLQDLIGQFTSVRLSTAQDNIALEKLGLDSIAAVQLATALLAQLHLQIHPDELFESSVAVLAGHVARTATSRPVQTSETPNSRSTHDSENLQEFTEPPIDSLAIPSFIFDAISTVAETPAEQIHGTQTLLELGIDSFSVLELKQTLEQAGQTELRSDEPDLSWTVNHIAKRLAKTRVPSPDGSHVPSIGTKTETIHITTPPTPDLSRSVNPFDILSQSNAMYEAAARKTGFAGYWNTVAPLQNDLLLGYINEAFITLGVDLSEHPCGVEIPIPAHIPKHGRLMKRLLDILESRYIIMQRGGKVLRGSDRIDGHVSSSLCEQLRTEHPHFECEAKLMNLIGPRLAECLSGKVDPISVLFSNAASRQIMDEFYRGAPMMAAHAEQLVSFFVHLTQKMAAGSHSQTPIRILEVGGGTGGTTIPLATALMDAKVPVEYTFTDIGNSFVGKARTKLGPKYPFMGFSALNIEEEVPEAFRGQYDIVMGANVVHATADRTATCRRLHDTLRPGGLLVLSELTHIIDWYDICFGLLDGWWLADGGKGYAIQPATVWMDAFDRAGYKSTGYSSGISEEANSQQLLVACATDWTTQ